MSTKVVVIGGTGLIGAMLIDKFRANGHDAVPASPDTGVNTVTGDGLADVLRDAAVVVDVSDAPSFDDAAALEFFDTSTRNVIEAERMAGVGHHVALSIVGTERLTQSGYFRARIKQEQLIKASPIPYSIVHATQLFEGINAIADAATSCDTVRVAPVLIQPIAADDVARGVPGVGRGAAQRSGGGCRALVVPPRRSGTTRPEPTERRRARS